MDFELLKPNLYHIYLVDHHKKIFFSIEIVELCRTDAETTAEKMLSEEGYRNLKTMISIPYRVFRDYSQEKRDLSKESVALFETNFLLRQSQLKSFCQLINKPKHYRRNG